MAGVSYALLATILLQSASAQTPQKPASPAQPATPRTQHYTATWSANSYLQSEDDSSVSPVQTTITYKNGSVYHIRMAGEKVLALSVDNHEIPSDSLYLYNNLTQKLALQIKADRAQAKLDKLQAEKDRAQALEDRKQAEKDEVQSKEDRLQAEKDQLQQKQDAEQALLDKLQAEREQAAAQIEKVQAEKEKITAVMQAKIMADDAKQASIAQVQTGIAQVQAARDRAQAAEDRRQAMQDRQQAERDLVQQVIEDRKQAEADRIQVIEDGKQAEVDRIQVIEDRKQAERDREQAIQDRKQAAEDRAMMKKLIGEIVAEGLIPNEKSLRSLYLDEDGLIINGKQQSDQLMKKFQKKYLLRPGYRIAYHNDQTGFVR